MKPADIASAATIAPVGAGAGGASGLRAGDLSRGTNQSGVRLYNERLVLALIRRHGALPKAEIARLTGLSAQTITLIMRQLSADGLVLEGEPQRGRVGQPSVPFSLDPDGALSLGLKIGRRSMDLVLIDFLGRVRRLQRTTYIYPTPRAVCDFVAMGVAAIVAELPPALAARVTGLGVASPFELWNWETEAAAPRDLLALWRGIDIHAEIAAVSPYPVVLCNDATAACAAELVFGNPKHRTDFLYVFVGYFIGGGVVLGGSLYPGRSGNAGALGSMPVLPAVAGAAPAQLIHAASLAALERRLEAAGLDPMLIWQTPDRWDEIEPHVAAWLAEVGDHLAVAIVAALSVVDFEAVVIDGGFPARIRARLVAELGAKLPRLNWSGLTPAEVEEGTVGSEARAIGAASLPLLETYARDREILFKETK
ncbi:ROK family transcriptional regulator [Methylobrevis albus]|uniref:ROK family transcriptional regulator n=1 Tax=Methylobrevis albus TaxID=2793297 RepID=A0A931HZP7_9HYPH|nr:ROK family transcriptional regulator [Methylobrevis albus]MBH0237450.1 ROK family transcriptional regulator [Methylobrevis albus]